MIVRISKSTPPQKIRELLSRTTKRVKKKSLRAHFGKLKRSLDGVAYQKTVRGEWN
jgi:hypothetical protein